jgi:hypothetical protein
MTSASASIVSSRSFTRAGWISSVYAEKLCARTTPFRSRITPRLGTIGTIAMRFVSASVW